MATSDSFFKKNKKLNNTILQRSKEESIPNSGAITTQPSLNKPKRREHPLQNVQIKKQAKINQAKQLENDQEKKI